MADAMKFRLAALLLFGAVATASAQDMGSGLNNPTTGSGGGGGSGTVMSVSVVTANGISGSVANPTTTPAITLTLGAITPSSVAIGAGSAITSSGSGGSLTSLAYLTPGSGIATALGLALNGSGAISASTSPTFVTPALGAATGTSLDGAAIGSVTPSTGAFTTLSATGQITSTLATGTAPLVVASTTNVANLNASSLGGATFAAPGPIGGTTPGSGNFTTVTGSGIVKTTSAGSAAAPSLVVGNATTGLYSVSTTGLGFSVNGANVFDYGITTASTLGTPNNFAAGGNISLNTASGLFRFGSSADVILSRKGAANPQLGNADTASPVAQTLSVQSVAAGNANTAGATWTLQGSLSNGSGGGDIIIKTTLSSAASGTQNAAANVLTLKGGTQFAAFAQAVSIGSSTPAAGQGGDLGQIKETDAAAAPGAGYAVLKWVAGTNAGSCKLISYAGTSATPSTVIDNVGTGC
jgi:hypothetical protein